VQKNPFQPSITSLQESEGTYFQATRATLMILADQVAPVTFHARFEDMP